MFDSKLKEEVKKLKEEVNQMQPIFNYYKKHYDKILARKYKKAVEIICNQELIKILGFDLYNSPKFNFHARKDFIMYRGEFYAQLDGFAFPEKEAEELFTLCQRYYKG